jgi:uncharacterized repeat protein (TIGR03803 family)
MRINEGGWSHDGRLGLGVLSHELCERRRPHCWPDLRPGRKSLRTTYVGGATGGGTAFKLTPHSDGSWTESVLYSFCSHPDHCAVGVGPCCLPLIFDTAGNLYGTTILGGASGQGTIFKLTPHSNGSWTQSVLHEFTGEDGSQPNSVIFDTAGNLYGNAQFGGASDAGTVFKLTPHSNGSWTESVLHEFTGMDGSQPNSVILDAAGNLYGTRPSATISANVMATAVAWPSS